MTRRAALLELERKKLTLLRNKLEEQARLVKTLEAAEDDPYDALLERELAAAEAAEKTNEKQAVHADVQTPARAAILEAAKMAATAASEAAAIHAGLRPSNVLLASSSVAWQRVPRRIPPTWVALLRFIGRDGKSYDDVVGFINHNSLPVTPGAARTQLMNYRKEFGFVDNPRKGFYQATEKALAFINAQEGESPTVGDGGASKTQPTPLTRAAA